MSKTMRVRLKNWPEGARQRDVIIDRAQFDPEIHELVEDVSPPESSSEDEIREREEAERRVRANHGQRPAIPVSAGRNASGTFPEPTPSDVRYSDDLETEFENNLGAQVGKSAAQMREAAGLPDAPGGLRPDPEGPLAKEARRAGLLTDNEREKLAGVPGGGESEAKTGAKAEAKTGAKGEARAGNADEASETARAGAESRSAEAKRADEQTAAQRRSPADPARG